MVMTAKTIIRLSTVDFANFSLYIMLGTWDFKSHLHSSSLPDVEYFYSVGVGLCFAVENWARNSNLFSASLLREAMCGRRFKGVPKFVTSFKAVRDL